MTAAAPPREWWQVFAQWRARWWQTHPVLHRRVATVRTVGLWLALVYLLVMLAVAPQLRWGVRAWVGACWVAVAWFFIARTKTLTWSAYMRFFAVCGAWAAVVVWVLTQVSSSQGMRVGFTGPRTFIAGVGEEALKLVPLVVVAIAAPRRVARFATVDFALLGVAAGAAFAGVEEACRRTWYFASDPVHMGMTGWDRAIYGNQLPPGWVRFGLWPIPPDLSSGAAGFGGHVVTTGIVAATLGLGVVVWRAARARGPGGWAVRCVAVAVPVVALVSVMADHMAYNAHPHPAKDWLDPAVTAVPWWLRVPWLWLGKGHYRPAVLVVLLVACLLVDGFRLASTPGSALVDQPAWSPVARAGAGLSRWHARARLPGRIVANTVNAVLAVVWTTVRDWGLVIAAHARQRGEPRREALRRGAAAVSAQRALREAAMGHHAGPVRAWPRALVALAVLAGLLVMALVVAPDLAAHTDARMHHIDPRWLAGLFDKLAHLWGGLSFGQQIAVGVVIAALVVLSGGSLGLAMGIAGVATWGLDKSAGIATFIRDPNQATRGYIANATPGQVVVDTLGVVLTFAPGNFAGASMARGARTAAREFADNPSAALARARARMDDAGAIDLAWLRSGKPVPLADGTAHEILTPAQQIAEAARYQSLHRSPLLGGNASGTAYQLRIYGNNEREIILPSGRSVFPDGFRSEYGAIGDAKLSVGASGSSFYAPEPGSSLERIAIIQTDKKLAAFDEAAKTFGGTGVIEYTTNSAEAAAFLEGRMAALGIHGYVIIVP